MFAQVEKLVGKVYQNVWTGGHLLRHQAAKSQEAAVRFEQI